MKRALPRAELSAHAFAIISVKPLRKFFPLQRPMEVTPTMARADFQEKVALNGKLGNRDIS
jgi:hypothetical protein